MDGFGIQAPAHVNVIRVGHAQSPVVCIDDFAAGSAQLLAAADDAVFIDAGSVYPGVRAPAPPGYVPALLTALAPLIEQVFGAPPEPELDLCAFSMVTRPPESLRAIQRVPHFDGPEARRLAFLHFLCDPGQGGTSFYRHRATSLELVTVDRMEDYRQRLVAELKLDAPGPAYVQEDTRYFEKIGTAGAAFNRLLVYRGNALHSGDIGPGTVLSEDPRRGRLTINGFGFLCC